MIYRNRLTERYSAEPEIKGDTWPVVHQNTYINLAIVSDKSVNSECEFSRHSLRGDSDDIYLAKRTTDYKSVLNFITPGSRLLIEGRPGSGKTTLVRRISQDWANKLMKWTSIRLLFLINLQSFQRNSKITLRDIVGQYFTSDENINIICNYADKHDGLGFCFVLDGFDEYKPDTRDTKDVFIFKLIKKEVLKKAIVIVSSRPAAVAEYRREADEEIEVIGFFKEQITEFIKSYKFSVSSRHSDLIRYLNEHDNVLHMCELPIHSAMICFLFDKNGSLPDTETQIYVEFTKHAILRSIYSQEDKNDMYLTHIHELQGRERNIFINICELAFEKTRSFIQLLNQAEIDKFNKDVNVEDSLGLITMDFQPTIHGFQKTFSFSHLTFQEFLAACYISYQEGGKQLELIKSCMPIGNHVQVIKFFCGLVKFDTDSTLFTDLMNSGNFKPLVRVQCAFEAQQRHVCDHVASTFLQFKDNFMDSSDFTALGYVITNSTQKVVRSLSLYCSPTKACLDAFAKALEGRSNQITTLEFRGCVRGQLESILKLMNTCPSLQVLSIADTEQDLKEILDLKKMVTHAELTVLKFCEHSGDNNHKPLTSSQLEVIAVFFSSTFPKFRNICFSAKSREYFYNESKNYSLSKSFPFFLYSILDEGEASFTNCEFSVPEVLALSTDLQLGSICTELSLINCNLDDEKVSLLAEMLNQNKILISLKLTANNISDKGATIIAKNLTNWSVQSIDLSLNKINDEGATALLDAAGIAKIAISLFGNNILLHTLSKHYTNSMKVLNIMGRVGDEGMAGIESYFVREDSLQTLHLSSCGNTFTGLESVVNIVKKCTFLLSITLSDCNIDDDGSILLASCLSHCNGLHTLDLSRNKIGSSGAQAIALSLKSCSKLSKLDLSGSHIGQVGARSLSQSLCNCREVRELHISNNLIGDVGAEVFGKVIRNNIQLRSLLLNGNIIGDKGASSLAKSLKRSVNMSIVDLSMNNIGKNGFIALAGSLKNCCKLQVLNVGYNTISEASHKLAKSLENCYHLIELNMSCNNIKLCGIEAIGEALRCCRGMQPLDLRENGICDAGIVALSDGLKVSTSLSKLNLSRNNIGGVGAIVMAYSLEKMKELVTLDLSHNNINLKGAIAIAQSLSSCSKLSSLNLSYNNIDKGLETLVDSFRNCTNLQSLDIRNTSRNGNEYIEYSICNSLPKCASLHTLQLGHDSHDSRFSRINEEMAVVLEKCHKLHKNSGRFI